MKRLVHIVSAILLVGTLSAQKIPEALEYTQIYDYLDELATDGVIHINSALKPFNRNTIAALLREAQQKDSLLNQRQRDDLVFYMQDFALELDTMPDYRLYGFENKAQWTDRRTFNLSLVEPAFHYRTDNSKFKMMLKPILGMDIYASKKGVITKRWYGAEIQMDIVNHVSVWGSLRDNSWSGPLIVDAQYLNNMPGSQFTVVKTGKLTVRPKESGCSIF